MKVCVAVDSELSEESLSVWRQIQYHESTLCSPFFCPEFMSAVASVRSDVRVATLWEDEKIVGFFPFQRDRFHMGRPVGGGLSDYHGVICPKTVKYVPEELLDACGLVTFDFDHLILASPDGLSFCGMRTTESPIIDLSDGYDAYVHQARRRGSRQVLQLDRKMRKFQREVGPLRCEPQVFQDLFGLLLLTGARSGNVKRMRWEQVDLPEGIWTIPAIEAKGKRPIVVPLATRAAEVEAPGGYRSSQAELVTSRKLEALHFVDHRHRRVGWNWRRGQQL